jgi:hypothetical protein
MRATALALLAALTGGCKGSDGENGGGITDAAPRADATQHACDEVVPVNLELGPAISAGGTDDLYRVGRGAWVAHPGATGPPGDILYLEAYRDLFSGMAVEVAAFANWQIECKVCVFVGRGCPAFSIEVNGDGDPEAPVGCEALYMLDRGRVELAALDTSPALGTLAGQVAALDGDSEVRFVEVGRSGNPGTPGGFGERLAGGGCIGTGAIDFSGAWDTTPDAGAPDADVNDAGPPDAPP